MSLTLILGGARSGKSTFAQQLAEAHQCAVLFVATAEAGDDEMRERIATHRAERPAHWHTLEEPHAIAEALAGMEPAPVVILDCVTLWVNNLLLREASWEHATAHLDALMAWYHVHAQQCALIIVSNEVGLGLVPADPLSRTYREWLGWFNQRLASEADQVYVMVAGLAVDCKALAVQAAEAARRAP
jgi:adenosylcobinamide kinase/adenosylcobinamide-phosphate guanylyltransferase